MGQEELKLLFSRVVDKGDKEVWTTFAKHGVFRSRLLEFRVGLKMHPAREGSIVIIL